MKTTINTFKNIYLRGLGFSDLIDITFRSGRHTEKRTYRYIAETLDYRMEDVTDTEGKVRREMVSYSILVMERWCDNGKLKMEAIKLDDIIDLPAYRRSDRV